MTGTINFEDGFISDEELRLLEIKHAMLKKLRVRFSKLDENKGRGLVTDEHSGHSTVRTRRHELS